MLSLKRNQPAPANGSQPNGRGVRLKGDSSSENGAYVLLRDRVQQRLLSELNPAVSTSNGPEVRRVIERIFGEVMLELNLPVSRAEVTELLEQVAADIMGFGPLKR